MQEIIQIITVLVALLGGITGPLGLYLRFRESKMKKPLLVAWVLSAFYVFQEHEEESDLNLEVELLIQNKGGKNTTISNVFAEIKDRDNSLRLKYREKGKISYQEAAERMVSGPVFMKTGASKNIHISFTMQDVNPRRVQRFLRFFTPGVSILEMPIEVSFTILHTHGTLKGDWLVYGKHQKIPQQTKQFLSEMRLFEGKPHWTSN